MRLRSAKQRPENGRAWTTIAKQDPQPTRRSAPDEGIGVRYLRALGCRAILWEWHSAGLPPGFSVRPIAARSCVAGLPSDYEAEPYILRSRRTRERGKSLIGTYDVTCF